ncbi:MAG: aminotransferase class V-fold PLP-dependent enzyme [Chloroflexi bacterium]|jgi:cysteine desulfurase|nr:aminotransferase class V-fold PLP-dependent enzyme [Chloroflexota bacterium]MBT7080653.1 aminotransferase class V-fold PLP-dependent enzyme [Chloroflexota bacterium]MBT7289940.1 aminotransferase class V-fold PLP-dependent enzyme [Chloroflexota bacterium]
MSDRKVYLDNTATNPVRSAVVDAMMPYLKEAYGNPQSMHDWGDAPREALDEARAKVATLIGAEASEIIFTSSGTESNNLAIKGLAMAQQTKGKHVVVSAIEHFSVLHSTKTLQKLGFEVTEVPVNSYGQVSPDDVKAALRGDTILVSIMLANGEVGSIQPIKEIAAIVKEAGIIFHTDAVAAAGNIPIDVNDLNVDALSFAANQFYGPKGVAALYLRKRTRITPLLDGGIQEGGKRAGTENVPAIVGMGVAAELAKADMESRAKQLSAIRDRLIKGVTAIPHVILTGHPTGRLPHHASFCVEFIEGESMLMLLSSQGVAASSGSACTSKALKSSHVLTAMGLPPEISAGSLVLTIGTSATNDDIDYVVDTLPPIVERLRQMSPLYAKYVKEQGGK